MSSSNEDVDGIDTDGSKKRKRNPDQWIVNGLCYKNREGTQESITKEPNYW